MKKPLIPCRFPLSGPFVAFLLLLLSCKGQPTQPEEAYSDSTEDIVELTEAQVSTIGLRLGSISQRQLAGVIHATGTLRLAPQDRAEVTSLVTGIARRILVKEGEAVRAGQTLALVENTALVALQKDYLLASRQLSLAEQAWQRQYAIHEQGAGVEKHLQQAKADLDMAAATEKGIRLQLEQLGIDSRQVAQGTFVNAAPVRSPITGIVGEILVSTGSYLTDGTVLMKVYDVRAMHADVNVFETDIAGIRVGQKVSMQLSDRAATRLTGTVSLITATIADDSKSASVHINLDGTAETILLPNMFVSAAICLDEQTCDAVPDEAIVMSANRKYVFVSLGNNRFRREEVVTGLSGQGYTQITFLDSEKPHGDIVIANAFYLSSR